MSKGPTGSRGPSRDAGTQGRRDAGTQGRRDAGTQGRRDAGTQNREFPLFNLSRSEESDTGESPDAAPRASLCPCLRRDGLRPKPPPKRPSELDCPLSLARTPPRATALPAAAPVVEGPRRSPVTAGACLRRCLSSYGVTSPTKSSTHCSSLRTASCAVTGAVAVASTVRCTPPPAPGCCRPRWRWRPAHRVGQCSPRPSIWRRCAGSSTPSARSTEARRTPPPSPRPTRRPWPGRMRWVPRRWPSRPSPPARTATHWRWQRQCPYRRCAER